MDLEKDKRKHDRMQAGVWVLWDETTRVKFRSGISRQYQRTRQELEDELRRAKGYLPDKALTGDETNDIAKRAIAKAGLIAVESRPDALSEEWSPTLTSEDERFAWVDMEHVYLKIAALMSNEANFEEERLAVLRKNS